MVWSAEDLGPIGVVTWLGFAGSRGDQWQGLGEGVVVIYIGDGGRIDGPCVDAARRAAVSGVTVAPAAGGLRNGAAV